MRNGIAAIGLAILASACGKESGDAPAATLRFTAIPNENTTELKEKFTPFAKHLSEKLGVPVEYVPTAEYSASVTEFENGGVHLAWFGGLTGVRARLKVEGAEAIAQGKADPEYHTYFIANPASGLKPSDAFPSGLAGKTFTFGSESSTSGRLMPEYFIRKHTGKSPVEFFGREPQFSGAHDKTAKLVESGAVEAGALDYKTYDRLVAEKRIDPAKCFVIWKTPAYPDYNWTAHPELDRMFGKGFIRKLQEALVGIKDPELLKAVNRPEGLIPAKSSDWDDLATLARELGLVR